MDVIDSDHPIPAPPEDEQQPAEGPARRLVREHLYEPLTPRSLWELPAAALLCALAVALRFYGPASLPKTAAAALAAAITVFGTVTLIHVVYWPAQAVRALRARG